MHGNGQSSFGVTYEGLKPDVLYDGIEKALEVLELPMRV